MLRRLSAVGSFRFWVAILATLVVEVSVRLHGAGADWKPAPQRFRQEWGVYGRSWTGLPGGAAALLDVSPDVSRTVRVWIQGAWYAPNTDAMTSSWSRVESLVPGVGQSLVIADGEGRPVVSPVPAGEVRQVVRNGGQVWLVSSGAVWVIRDGAFQSVPVPSGVKINQMAVAAGDKRLLGTERGLYRWDAGKSGWEAWWLGDVQGRMYGTSRVLAVGWDDGGKAWFATPAVVGRETPTGWEYMDGNSGLPWNEFTGMAAGEGGAMWFGSTRGVMRWEQGEWHYRSGRVWLPREEVSGIVVDGKGRAWVATAEGPGCIGWQETTLHAKAAHYEVQIERYIKRTEFGYVAEAPLPRPGDLESATRNDSDNDGLWTAMYGAGECLGYAATRESALLKRSKQAFEALRFLQKVTQGGSNAPPKGFVARSILPTSGPNPNRDSLDGDRREQSRDALWKVYHPRWPVSADGKWYWKSDTSSDELDGHYFFLGLYYEHCAETAEEKERVREVVRDLTDHLIQHGYNLVDHDGRPTRWGVFGPESLNRDSRWWAERGLNSLSILSYLTVAGYVTGDAKYEKAVNELMEQHGYAMNLVYPKVQSGPGSGNQSDDEMAFMGYYSLLRYSKNEKLKGMVRISFNRYWLNEAPEMNPLFNFMYAAHSLGQTIQLVWGSFPMDPLPDWHSDSMKTLWGFPLDRVEWGVKNSHRLDVVRLPVTGRMDFYHPDRRARGHRVNGKVLPVENRYFHHWNTDPWTLDEGGSGHSLGSGTVYLLPYYLGMYHGYIEKP